MLQQSKHSRGCANGRDFNQSLNIYFLHGPGFSISMTSNPTSNQMTHCPSNHEHLAMSYCHLTTFPASSKTVAANVTITITPQQFQDQVPEYAVSNNTHGTSKSNEHITTVLANFLKSLKAFTLNGYINGHLQATCVRLKYVLQYLQTVHPTSNDKITVPNLYQVIIRRLSANLLRIVQSST